MRISFRTFPLGFLNYPQQGLNNSHIVVRVFLPFTILGAHCMHGLGTLSIQYAQLLNPPLMVNTSLCPQLSFVFSQVSRILSARKKLWPGHVECSSISHLTFTIPQHTLCKPHSDSSSSYRGTKVASSCAFLGFCRVNHVSSQLIPLLGIHLSGILQSQLPPHPSTSQLLAFSVLISSPGFTVALSLYLFKLTFIVKIYLKGPNLDACV